MEEKVFVKIWVIIRRELLVIWLVKKGSKKYKKVVNEIIYEKKNYGRKLNIWIKCFFIIMLDIKI